MDYKSLLLLLILMALAVIFSAIYVSALRHRLTKEHELSPLSGSLFSEMLWMTVPTAIVIGIILYTFYFTLQQEISHRSVFDEQPNSEQLAK